jgi:hypothetical protein
MVHVHPSETASENTAEVARSIGTSRSESCSAGKSLEGLPGITATTLIFPYYF